MEYTDHEKRRMQNQVKRMTPTLEWIITAGLTGKPLEYIVAAYAVFLEKGSWTHSDVEDRFRKALKI